jgi:hypothetical protein
LVSGKATPPTIAPAGGPVRPRKTTKCAPARVQLIDLGYKMLAMRLHPDTGGSTEAMTRRTRVRDVFKRHVGVAWKN